MSECISCGEPLDYPSGEGCAAMTKHKERGLVRQERLDEALAKLDKAMDALRFYSYWGMVIDSDDSLREDDINRDCGDKARKTLAELEKE